MIDFELIDVQKNHPQILCDIKYATKDNFAGQRLYREAACFLRKAVAHKLAAVQASLEKQALGLKIWDGYRPLSVQKIFWEILPDERYVANPAIGSKHNRGAAVDVTLVDLYGKELPMPTPFDDFSIKAHRDYNDLSEEVRANRELLEDTMVEHGFIPFPTEWWHFDDADWQLYPIEDIPIEMLSK